jgi:hypothetical protein
MTSMRTRTRPAWWLLSIGLYLVLLIAGLALLPNRSLTDWGWPLLAAVIAAAAVAALQRGRRVR